MRNRVEKSTKELIQVQAELQQIKALNIGMATVTETLEAQITRLRREIEEDTATLVTLEGRASEVFAAVLKMTSDVQPHTPICVHLALIKHALPALEIQGLGNDWSPPVYGEVEVKISSSSPKPFNSAKAASLGLAALLPKGAHMAAAAAPVINSAA